MFGSWQSFYQMTGEVAATLIGLLFIVTSLTSGRPVTSTTVRGVALFMTPTLFHLASVLVISALALAPDGEGEPRAGIMAGWAVLGLAYATVLAYQLRAIPDPTHWTDSWLYGVAPSVTYLALAAATLSACAAVPHAAYFVALCLIVLLLVTIRNAWDLVTWLAPRRDASG